jgi:tetratricopeptide (TPR) repeat protein
VGGGRVLFSFATAILLLLVTGRSTPQSKIEHPGGQRPQNESPHFRNTAPNVHYVGSKVCQSCHAEIFEKFFHTDMGNSMFTPDRLADLGWLAKPIDIFNEHHNRHYQIYARDSHVHQSEYEIDDKGHEVFRHTEELAYVIGTGANGATPIVRRGNYFFEAPLSYYSATKSWDLSPNFDVRDLGFSLPMTSDCVGCHSGRIQPVRNRDALYEDPAVLETAIGCEKCHGPGELHVAERQMDAPIPSGPDTSIVNPAKLSPWLADNICMNCHEGDIRALQAGKSWEDFRPGTPLNDTVIILKAPIDPRAEQSPLLEHYYSMTLSRCYRERGGKLGCQSCHDPHEQPSAEKAPAYFRDRCLHCHTDKSCTLALPKRLALQSNDACAACHMARQPALTVSHSTLTDHRILRTPDEPYPKSSFTASLPGTGFIHVNAIPGKPDSVPPVALLKSYRQELIRSRLEYKGYYFALLDRLAKSGNKDQFVLSAIAQKAASEGDLPKAINFARQVVDRGPTSESDYLLLDGLLARSGDLTGSIDVLKKGLALSPFSNSLYESLVARQQAIGATADAAATASKALELFPEDKVLRTARQTASADHIQQGIAHFKQGDLQSAVKEFQAAIEADPQNAVAHDYIGIVSGESGNLTEATSEFQQAAQLDHNFAEPHAHLALAYIKTGKIDRAIAEYQEALRVKPGMLEAQYGLSEICTKVGDLDGAIQLLRAVTIAEPNFAEGHLNLALNLWNRYKKSSGLRQKSDLDEAAQDAKKAADLDPQRTTNFLALGQIDVDRGDLAPAVDSLQRAVALDPSNAEFHYNLGLALRLKGDLDSAKSEFRAALNLAPSHALARRSLGLVLRETGDLPSAANELRQSVAQLPDDAQGHHLLGTVLLRQNDLEGAIAEFRRAVQLDPGLNEARASLAQALQKAGKKQEAQDVSAELRKKSLDDSNVGQAMVLVQTAAGYSNKAQYADAVRTLKEAVGLAPNFTEAQYQLGIALRESGDDKSAQEVFRKVLQFDPEHPAAHQQLGTLLIAQGDAVEGRSELERAVQLAPSLADAHVALAKLAKRSRDWDTAIHEFQAVLAWRPQDRAMHQQLAEALKASGAEDEAAHEMRLAEQYEAQPPVRRGGTSSDHQ